MKIARIYLRVSIDEQDLTRQAEIEHSTRSAGYYIAGVYREKASGARADRPELLRMIADLQPDEVVVAEKIDRISRLPLGLVEDTRGNHPQAKAASQLNGVHEGFPSWTAKLRLYLIERTLFPVGNWRSHLWTAW